MGRAVVLCSACNARERLCSAGWSTTKGYGCIGGTGDGHVLKNEAQAADDVEQSRSRDDAREDLLASSRAGHASRRARS